MHSELERLKERLFAPGGLGARNVKIFPGGFATTAEDVARAMNKALDDIAAGRGEVVEGFTD